MRRCGPGVSLPKYLEADGLAARWREALLAQAVLRGETEGHRRHPQLVRIRHQIEPVSFITTYLQHVSSEAVIRGYRFDGSKISPDRTDLQIDVPTGQFEIEWLHLAHRLRKRIPERYAIQLATAVPALDPLFQVLPGDVASRERGA